MAGLSVTIITPTLGQWEGSLEIISLLQGNVLSNVTSN